MVKKRVISRLHIFFVVLLQPLFPLHAGDTLMLSRSMSEVRFLQENLLLIAGRMHIDKAEALMIQERYWPNPTFSVDEVNLWATQSQLGYFGEELPPLLGDFGRNRQLSMELEQLILTAGKRKKRVAVERVSVDIAREEFEDLMRHLRLEFRNTLTGLQHMQLLHSVYEGQRENIDMLIRSFERQHSEGHIGTGELVRLQALGLELSRTLYEISTGINSMRRELQSLLNLPHGVIPVLTTEDFIPDTTPLDELRVVELLERAMYHRPDLRIQALSGEYSRRQYDLARANRIPDVTFRGGYDRGGNFMLNFIGAGITVDLPLFDRNRGNIMHAGYGIRQSEILLQHKESDVRHEVMEAYSNLLLALQFYRGITPGLETTLEHLMESYTRSLIRRDISLIEYIDFLHAYTEHRSIILDGAREVRERTEALQYILGTDIQ
jgi:outer membrane protein, heavy metal efflux system